jgi:hypothetical protein
MTIEIMELFYELAEEKIRASGPNAQVCAEERWFQAFSATAWTLWTR